MRVRQIYVITAQREELQGAQYRWLRKAYRWLRVSIFFARNVQE
jgi:hypothetical protein